jgi:hypothetical protein
MRIEGGSVPVVVRVTLFGLKLEEPLELPFGRLLPGTDLDRVLMEEPAEMPASAVFESVVDAPAAMVKSDEFAWSVDGGEDKQAELIERVDDGLGRLLIALALSHPGPIQEHVLAYAPLYWYWGRFSAHEAVPLGPVWATHRLRARDPEFRLDRFSEMADLTARLDKPRPIAVAARRYFQAGAERARPADALVDYALAIEALTGTSSGKQQGKQLAALMRGYTYFPSDFVELKDARNSILHDGVTPPGARALLMTARSLVETAITAAVRDQASPGTTTLIPLGQWLFTELARQQEPTAQ